MTSHRGVIIITTLSLVVTVIIWPCCTGAKERDRLIQVTDDYGYYVAFRIQAGINISAYAQFMDTAHNDDEDPLDLDFALPCGCKTPYGPCPTHFRSRLLDKWEHLPVDKVRVGLYKGGIEQKYLLFNGQNTTFTDWFSKSKLISSSYTDLWANVSTCYFAIMGDGDQHRRFFIHRKYIGCNKDKGWLVVVDGPNPSCNDTWERTGGAYPTIFYSPSNTSSNYSAHVEKADVMIISVRMKPDHCSCSSD